MNVTTIANGRAGRTVRRGAGDAAGTRVADALLAPEWLVMAPGRLRAGQPVSSGSSYQVTFSPTRARILQRTDFGAASIACRSRSAPAATACA